MGVPFNDKRTPPGVYVDHHTGQQVDAGGKPIVQLPARSSRAQLRAAAREAEQAAFQRAKPARKYRSA